MSARTGLYASRSRLAGSQLNLWRELACFALIFVELSWVTPWYIQLIAPTTGATPWRVFSGFFLIITGAYLETRLVEALRLAVRLRLALFLIYIIFSTLFGLKFLFYYQLPFGLWGSLLHLIQVIRQIGIWIPREFAGIFTLFLVNLTGVRLALEPPEPYRVFRSFTTGVGLFILLGLIYVTVPAWISTGMLALFLVSSLLGMCAARFALLGSLRGSQRIPFDRERLLEVSLFIGFLAGISLLLASLARAPAPFQFLYEIAEFAFKALLLVVALIMAPFYLILALLFPNIQPSPVIANFLNFVNQILNQLRDLFAGITNRLSSLDFIWFFSLRPIIQAGILILAILLILIWVRHLILQKQKKGLQETEQIPLEESFARLQRPGLRNPFRILLERLMGRSGWTASQQSQAAERIRQIYAELCHQAARLDRPREDSQTPLEYLPALKALFPGNQGDLAIITQAYLRVRYGELPETQDQVDVVLLAWERISKESAQRLKKTKIP